ncbi:MAG: TRAP transporter small permease [Pleomorphochaeta sp.]|jgi:TRAP-type C4-dicarboxylate transport system permease small subunit
MKKGIIGKIHGIVIDILTKFLVVLSMLITCTVFLNVLSRYILEISLPWSEELARFMFIWLSFIGAVIANAQFSHMRLDFIVEKLPVKTAKVVEGISYLVAIVLFVFLFIGSLRYTQSQWDWRSSALGIRHGIVYMITPICFSIMGLQFVARFIQLFISDKGEV